MQLRQGLKLLSFSGFNLLRDLRLSLLMRDKVDQQKRANHDSGESNLEFNFHL